MKQQEETRTITKLNPGEMQLEGFSQKTSIILFRLKRILRIQKTPLNPKCAVKMNIKHGEVILYAYTPK